MLRSMEFSLVSSGPEDFAFSLAWSSIQDLSNFSRSGDGPGFSRVPSKLMRTVTLCRSSFASAGGFGNGTDRSTMASVAASSGAKPVLSTSTFEINLPERSTTNVTPVSPL